MSGKTKLTDVMIERVARALHVAIVGTDPDELIHHPAQKSWEVPSQPRWQQWEEAARACVNPEHLEPVTVRENTLRGEGLAAQEARRTCCPQGHPYSGNNLIQRRGRRFCRECNRLGLRAYRARQRAKTGAQS